MSITRSHLSGKTGIFLDYFGDKMWKRSSKNIEF